MEIVVPKYVHQVRSFPNLCHGHKLPFFVRYALTVDNSYCPRDLNYSPVDPHLDRFNSFSGLQSIMHFCVSIFEIRISKMETQLYVL